MLFYSCQIVLGILSRVFGLAWDSKPKNMPCLSTKMNETTVLSHFSFLSSFSFVLSLEKRIRVWTDSHT